MGLEALVRGYTVNAAAWRAESTGTLTPGKYGDLVVLDRDIFALSPHAVGETRVLLTLLEGKEVHRDAAFEA